jgi:hypothetical protein
LCVVCLPDTPPRGGHAAAWGLTGAQAGDLNVKLGLQGSSQSMAFLDVAAFLALPPSAFDPAAVARLRAHLQGHGMDRFRDQLSKLEVRCRPRAFRTNSNLHQAKPFKSGLRVYLRNVDTDEEVRINPDGLW